MRKTIPFLSLLIVLCTGCNWGYDASLLQTGDLIFQTSTAANSAINIISTTPYTNMGLVLRKNDSLWVLEATKPNVRLSLLDNWVQQGKDQHFVAKRLKNADEVLDSLSKINMWKIAQRYVSKDYDPYLEWTNDRLYCSELVWKVYKQTLGVEIDTLQPFKNFDYKRTEVKNLVQELYGENLPMNEVVVSPSNIFNSSLFQTVFDY